MKIWREILNYLFPKKLKHADRAGSPQLLEVASGSLVFLIASPPGHLLIANNPPKGQNGREFFNAKKAILNKSIEIVYFSTCRTDQTIHSGLNQKTKPFSGQRV